MNAWIAGALALRTISWPMCALSLKRSLFTVVSFSNFGFRLLMSCFPMFYFHCFPFLHVYVHLFPMLLSYFPVFCILLLLFRFSGFDGFRCSRAVSSQNLTWWIGSQVILKVRPVQSATQDRRAVSHRVQGKEICENRPLSKFFSH